MRTGDECARWLGFYTKSDFSDLGKEVALFLEEMWGLHHLNTTSLKKVNWSNSHWIAFTYFGTLSTVDNNDLTRLVVLAHQRMFRLSLKGNGPGYVELMFHKRTCRTGSIYNRCPDILEHVKEIAAYHPAVDAQPEEVAA